MPILTAVWEYDEPYPTRNVEDTVVAQETVDAFKAMLGKRICGYLKYA